MKQDSGTMSEMSTSDEDTFPAVAVSVNGSSGTADEEDVDIGKRTRRLAMNRITARERRRRKRQHLGDLEGEVEKMTIANEDMQRMNADLRVQINSVISAISLTSSPSNSSSTLPASLVRQQMTSQAQAQAQTPLLGTNMNSLLNPALINPRGLEVLSSLQPIQNQPTNTAAFLLGALRGQDASSQSQLIGQGTRILQDSQFIDH